MKAGKGKKRNKIVDSIVKALKSDDIFSTINYRNLSESRIKQSMYPYLVRELTRLYKGLSNISDETAEKKAKKSLLWESNVNTTINNSYFMGTNHRPDFVVNVEGLKIAIEVKRGDDGTSIREGIGQTLVYSNIYDFTIYLFVDITKDKKILNSIGGETESKFIKNLWDDHNVKFEVV